MRNALASQSPEASVSGPLPGVPRRIPVTEDQLQNTQVGGLSALTYDRLSQRFYALSDDRDKARFYTLNPTLTTTAEGEVVLENMEVEDVTFLRDEKGATYAQGTWIRKE